MAIATLIQPDEPGLRAVAPAWHTAIILFIVLGFSLEGGRSGNMPGVAAYGRAGGYLLVMIMEWSVVGFIWYSLSRRGIRMADLVGGRWPRAVDFLRDLGIAIAFFIVCGIVVVNGLGYLLKAGEPQGLRNLFPQSGTEIILYLMLSLAAGFCEEVIFRGYLRRQFSALTQSAAGGIVLQGIAFGAGHGYQGWKFMLLIAVYGSLFGLLAHWRRSLRPGMITHFVQDGLGGLVGGHLMK